jgi:hypothetical protein
LSGGLNGSYFVNSTTVFNDQATDARYGGAGIDRFFAHQNGRKDLVYGLASPEVVTTI